MFGIAADDGMVFQVAEAAGESHVLGAAAILIFEKQHLVSLSSQGFDFEANSASSCAASAIETPCSSAPMLRVRALTVIECFSCLYFAPGGYRLPHRASESPVSNR